MKSTINVLHAVTGVTFVIGLYTVSNDNSVLKFMIIDDNKQICYLDVVSPALKNILCECYNVLVDIPTTIHQLVHSDKNSH